MSMSDTAEYWEDVKKKRPKPSITYYHIPNGVCSHYNKASGNTLTTPYIGDINCRECMLKIKNGYTENLIEGKAPETFYMSRRVRKAFNAAKIFNEKHGKCSCGSHWAIRRRKSDGKEFLGCSNYPHCNNTKTPTN